VHVVVDQVASYAFQYAGPLSVNCENGCKEWCADTWHLPESAVTLCSGTYSGSCGALKYSDRGSYDGRLGVLGEINLGRSLFAAILAAVAAASTPAVADTLVTGNDLLRYCQDPQVAPRNMCLGYVLGAVMAWSGSAPMTTSARAFRKASSRVR
jgi:hypothetical protein